MYKFDQITFKGPGGIILYCVTQSIARKKKTDKTLVNTENTEHFDINVFFKDFLSSIFIFLKNSLW